jgi:hypothetical protein
MCHTVMGMYQCKYVASLAALVCLHYTSRSPLSQSQISIVKVLAGSKPEMYSPVFILIILLM